MDCTATLTTNISSNYSNVGSSESKSAPNSPETSPQLDHKTPPPLHPKPKNNILVKSFLADQNVPPLNSRAKPAPPIIKAKPITPVLIKREIQLPPTPPKPNTRKLSLGMYRTISAGINDNRLPPNKVSAPITKPRPSIRDAAKLSIMSLNSQNTSLVIATDSNQIETFSSDERGAKTISRDSGIEVSPFKRNSDTDSPDLNTPPKLAPRPNSGNNMFLDISHIFSPARISRTK